MLQLRLCRVLKLWLVGLSLVVVSSNSVFGQDVHDYDVSYSLDLKEEMKSDAKEIEAEITINDDRVVYSIKRLSNQSIFIEDWGYLNPETTPSTITIRVADENGEIFTHNFNRVEGWWNKHVFSSTAISLNEIEYIELLNGEAISGNIALKDLFLGLKIENKKNDLFLCKVQVKLSVPYKNQGDNINALNRKSLPIVTSFSNWIDRPCNQLDGINWS